ncbi:hypothetical protein [Polynucleobacter brandtiae]|uniref:Phosphodiesterase n=1 Tax=Polynucleobacter brandtiae TaxID=1938816 RepID=A0A2M8VR62_9BURK|nr:hypothetical protein [Polynucleobacter brandtiae]PJI79931.1 hypothetical protein B0G85_0914 [Polynucleobacter brandtiae]
MLKIIAHRGMWDHPAEKNTLASFERALKHGFGIETDFRDYGGQLVVSHDIPDQNAVSAKTFFELCDTFPVDVPHALNVKSDGLQKLLSAHLQDWSEKRYFLFDMAVPDMLGYLNMQLTTYVRVSEYESYHDYGGRASGVWLDAFKGDWYRDKGVELNLFSQNPIAIVSPELHGRDHHLDTWNWIKNINTPQNQLLLCTDLPLQAQEFFNE